VNESATAAGSAVGPLPRRQVALLFLLALLVTFLNAVKPLHIDDAFSTITRFTSLITLSIHTASRSSGCNGLSRLSP